MMTSSRPREVGASFAQRRGHAATLSISDPSHHVTEAIGTLYGSDDDDDDDSRGNRKTRPLSFMTFGDEQLPRKPMNSDQTKDPRQNLEPSASDKSNLTSRDATRAPNTKKPDVVLGRILAQSSPSAESSSSGKSMVTLSPTPSLRDMQAAQSSMSMTNINNPNDIAQELSNLQALRRLSMDVGNASDPDLIPFSGIVPIPAIAPSGGDDEADPSRLLWVPANVHPELAPEQFKSFLERRVKSARRRSGETMLSTDAISRNNLGSLRRTKSKLSRQIDNSTGRGGDGYVDGADMLGRTRSQKGYATPELSLDELVNDPTRAVQKLAHDASDGAAPEDMPILPVAPGMGLRRSTRTQYRKSGSLRAERTPFSKRVAHKQYESREEDPPPLPQCDELPPVHHALSRAQSEPQSTENFSRPRRSVKRQQSFVRHASSSTEPATEQSFEDAQPLAHGRERSNPSDVPQIIETPPPAEQLQALRYFPERTSPQKTRAQLPQKQRPLPPQHYTQARGEEKPASRNNEHSPSGRQPAPPIPLDNVPGPTQTLDDIANHPSALPGPSGTRTDNITFIPTFSDAEKKKARDSDNESSKSTKGWKWFKTEDKKRDKEKEKEKEEQIRRFKSKSSDKTHENARLDVLQSSMENAVSKGRESLLLDRDNIDNKLQEERRKESSRKSGDGKKEKDGFFGSFFGGKKKADKDGSSKKHQQLALSPEPHSRQLRPDIDYPYTRFPILEERAIYRMAHIKLANPKRNLLSQVLLSNFMYSYLAKIQAMHPQIQVPVSPQQKRLEEERRRQEQEAQQQAYMEQQMSQQAAQTSIDRYNFDYHRSGHQYGDAEGEYVDENYEPYDDEHGWSHGGQDAIHDQNERYGYGYDAYRQQDRQHDIQDPPRTQDNDEMW